MTRIVRGTVISNITGRLQNGRFPAEVIGPRPVPTSIGAKVMPSIIRVRGTKKIFSSAVETVKQAEEHRIRPESFAPPKGLDRTVDIDVRYPGTWPVYTVKPRGRAVERRALYTHGGAWIYEISPFHWKLIENLATRTGTEFTVPIYPLAPRGTAATVVHAITDLVDELVSGVGPDNVTLIGDSAGGTITLAAAMQSRDRGLPAPTRVILISPVVDPTFTDPRIADIAPTDPWLAAEGLRAAGEMWRGALPFTDPLVSPGRGRLSGLGRISLFSGTHDITNADARTLVSKATAEQHPLDFYEEPKLLHVYPLLPIREGAEARRNMKRIMLRSS